MTTRRDEAKLREVADHHAADDPALAAQLHADADYLAQLRKASTNVNGDNMADDAGSPQEHCWNRDSHFAVAEGPTFRLSGARDCSSPSVAQVRDLHCRSDPDGE